MNSPVFSIIIPTKNEKKNIGRLLHSIREQRFPQEQIEVILVDNHSTDRTKEIAGTYTPYVFECGPERSAQRNFGMERARGAFFMYLDADMALSPSVVAECVECLNDHREIAGLYIPEIIVGEGYWGRVRQCERALYTGTVIDAVRVVRRDIFFAVGGFDTALTGPEDWDFDKKVRRRGKTACIQAPLYHHEGTFDLHAYQKKKSYYAKSLDAYIAKWGTHDPDIRQQFGAWYRLAGVFIERGKWRSLIRHPLLALGMFFLRVKVGWVFLRRIKNKES